VGGVYFLFRREVKEALFISLVVFSHWILDFLTHRPDLPLSPGSDMMFGLGLWNSVFWTMVVELSVFAIGIVLYVLAKRRQGSNVRPGFWVLAGFLFVVWLANIFGPPPPGEEAVAIVTLALWLLVPIGYLVDRKPVGS
jgi:hypothetical protein